MKCPPVDRVDLAALGLANDVEIAWANGSFLANGPASRTVRGLLREIAAKPAPEGDRMAYLRHVRDILIGLSDWTQATDAPLTESQRAAWATYRQALRDLPQAYSGDGPIPWPVAP